MTMHNLINHDYVAIDPMIIWYTATQQIQKHVAVCREELERLKG